MNCSCCSLSQIQWNLISIAHDRLFFMVLLVSPEADALSVLMGVGGCIWPSSAKVVQIDTASCPLRKMAPTSALAAEAITLCNLLHVMCIAPFIFGLVGGFKGFGDWLLR